MYDFTKTEIESRLLYGHDDFFFDDDHHFCAGAAAACVSVTRGVTCHVSLLLG